MDSPRVVYVTTVDMTVRLLLLNQLFHLQKAGYQVSAVCAEGPWSGEIRAAGIELHPIAMRREVSPLADLLALGQLVAYFRQLRPRIVHTHTPKANLLGRLAARLAGVPVVLGTEHGFYFYGMTGPQRAFYVLLARLGAACSDGTFVINREDVETARREGIGRPGQVFYLEGGVGVDLARYAPGADSTAAKSALGLPPQAPVTGIVGRLTQEKGFGDFLQGAARVRKSLPQACFLLAGPADVHQRADWGSQAGALGLAGAVVFASMRTDMPQVYAAMDVLCLPTYREGLPAVLMEAAAMGKPAVATDIRGCRDVVIDGVTGLLVPVGDSEALSRALLRLLRDPEEARQMGHAARQRAEAVFDEQKVFAQVEAMYQRLLQAA